MSKKLEIGEDDFGEKIGIWDITFRRNHVGRRDMKRKGENREYFAESEKAVPEGFGMNPEYNNYNPR